MSEFTVNFDAIEPLPDWVSADSLASVLPDERRSRQRVESGG